MVTAVLCVLDNVLHLVNKIADFHFWFLFQIFSKILATKTIDIYFHENSHKINKI